MTPEKILAMLPKIVPVLKGKYEGCYNCEMIGRNTTINDCANALAGKVVAKEDLLTVEEIWEIILDNINANSYSIIAEAVVKAQQRKAKYDD
jgi:hypothetical protein